MPHFSVDNSNTGVRNRSWAIGVSVRVTVSYHLANPALLSVLRKKSLVGAIGLEPTNPHHVKVVLYQLSYAPASS